MRRIVLMVLVALATVAGASAATSVAVADSTSGVITAASFAPVAPAKAGSDASTNIALSFSYANGSDTAQSLNITFPPGFLAAPAAVSTMCTTVELAASACPAASEIGTGQATVDTVIGTQTATLAIYLMPAPSSASVVGVGVALSADVLGLAINTTATGTGGFITGSGGTPQLQISLPDLPATVPVPVLGSVAIQLEQLNMTLNGQSATGQQFLYLPTSCSSAAASFATTTVNGANGGATSSFTPTGCPLAYGNGAVSAAAQAVDSNDDAAFQTIVSFPTGGANTTGVTIGIPSTALRANPLYAGLNCPTAPPFTGCTDIGTVSATTPLLSTPLTGTAYLTGSVAGFGIGLAFPAPFNAISLSGAVTSAGGQTTVTFTGIPDLPLAKLELALTGSSSSAFITSCAAGTQTLTAALSGAGGAGTDNTSTPITITGCPAVGANGSGSQVASYGKGASPSHFTPTTARSTKTTKVTPPRVSAEKLTGIGTGRPSLTFTVREGSKALKSFVLTLPSGLSYVSPRLAKALHSSVTSARRLSHNRLTITPKRAAKSVTVRIGAGGLSVSSALKREVRARRKGKLTFKLAVSAGTSQTHLTFALNRL